MSDSSSRLTGSAEETEGLGEALASHLERGDIVILSGPLGAGKTRFATGVARGLGSRDPVRSPSFTLVNEYQGREALLHVDLYRLETRDVESLGIDEGFERAVLIVEWGEKLPSRWRGEALELRFERLAGDERRIVASAAAGRGLALLDSWCNAVAGRAAP
jgi:tRNA threonylcarbamoyladenosine biosynthesis protein TsaE